MYRIFNTILCLCFQNSANGQDNKPSQIKYQLVLAVSVYILWKKCRNIYFATQNQMTYDLILCKQCLTAHGGYMVTILCYNMTWDAVFYGVKLLRFFIIHFLKYFVQKPLSIVKQISPYLHTGGWMTTLPFCLPIFPLVFTWFDSKKLTRDFTNRFVGWARWILFHVIQDYNIFTWVYRFQKL
jgi:hypothetical protein